MRFDRKIFVFGTKGETLGNIDCLLEKSSVPAFEYFTVEAWQVDRKNLLSGLIDGFGSEPIIIRSSALSEDSESEAMAGAYLSIPLTGKYDDTDICEAVDKVIQSYSRREGESNTKDQILVQRFVENVSMSGVVFTQDLNNGAPYYVINYDDVSGRTDTVSGGSEYSNRTLLVHRDSCDELVSTRFRALMAAVIEIESVVDSNCLDIEFALDQEMQVHLFQVRKITTQPNWNRGITILINDAINRLSEDLTNRLGHQSGLYGDRTVFGRMPDWNPAEMIGTKPRPLALSLYRYLITDQAWRIARKSMGYLELSGMPLMQSFCGQPFIDVRLSLNSFLPQRVNKKIAAKLVNYWIERLQENPQFHDKIEFDVVTTVRAFDFRAVWEARYSEVLKPKELDEYENALGILTGDLISGRVAPISEQLEKVESLDQRRQKHHMSFDSPDLGLVSVLLEDCIEYGTIPFSILARHGFIATSFLNSLVHLKILTDEDVESIHKSIPTVASEYVHDLDSWQNSTLSWESFITKYGHLRPGTYDISSIRYDQRDPASIRISRANSEARPVNPFQFSDDQTRSINKLLKQFEYDISAEDLLDYITSAIKGREQAKFLFTRNISDALEVISEWGERIGLNNKELSCLDIRQILDTMVVSEGRFLESHLRSRANEGASNYEITNALNLPHLICATSDLFVVPLILEQPNFISRITVQGELSMLKGSDDDPTLIDEKIVLIESADPGFDWVFARPIKALITKFGGANSHMAIRCAEFGLPAAIGCGEQIFDRLLNADSVELNCAEERITPLH